MTKNNKNIKPVPAGKKNTTAVQCQELVDDFERMVEARDKNLEASKKQLIEMLNITADKYLTVTGTMEALRTLRAVCGNQQAHYIELDGETGEPVAICGEISYAQSIAKNMSNVAKQMAEKAEKLGYAEMEHLCEGFYEEDFTNYDHDAEIKLVQLMATELMKIDLCRNVGPAAEDMVAFLDRVDAELAEVTDKLDELDEDWATKYEPTPKEQ